MKEKETKAEEVLSSMKAHLEEGGFKQDTDVRTTAVDLTRLLLNTPTAFLLTDEEIDYKEYRDVEMWNQANTIVNLPVFHFIIDAICAEQTRNIACKSLSHDTDMIGRGTINGAILVRERLEIMSAQFRQKFGENVSEKAEQKAKG